MTRPDAPWAIISALPAECHAIQDSLASRQEERWVGGVVCRGALDTHPVVVAVCGVGKVLAAMTTQYVIDRYHPRAVLFVGLAGGLHAGIARGDIVIGKELLQHDLDARAAGFSRGQVPYTNICVLAGDSKLVSIAHHCHVPGRTVHAGKILTGDQFIARANDSEWQYLTTELKGDAVEMEGASTALVAHMHQIPCLVIRTISDSGDAHAFNDFRAFLNEAQQSALMLVRQLLAKA